MNNNLPNWFENTTSDTPHTTKPRLWFGRGGGDRKVTLIAICAILAACVIAAVGITLLVNQTNSTEDDEVVVIVPREGVEGVVVESTNEKIIVRDGDGDDVEIISTPGIGPDIPIYEVGEVVYIDYLVLDDGNYYDGPTPGTI